MYWNRKIPDEHIEPREPSMPMTGPELLAKIWPRYWERKTIWDAQAARSATSREYRRAQGR